MMMIDFESLLEFEESLGQGLDHSHAILSRALENKVDHLRLNDEDEQDSISSINLSSPINLDEIVQEYNILEDEFAACTSCGHSFNDKDTTSTTSRMTCCQFQIEFNSTVGPSLEKSYWTSFLENPTRTISTLPYYTEFLCLKQGIPNSLRSSIWKKLFLLNSSYLPRSIQLIYQNFQHSYNVEVSQQIQKDLCRTFPTIDFFRKTETIDDLSTILNVYANYDAELGYCQGLLFLVGVLYHHLNSDCELTFHALTNIMEIETELHDIFTPSLMFPTLNKWFGEFTHILKQADEELYTHLTSFTDLSTFLYQWWLSFMSSHTPNFTIINRQMDLCMLQGWKIGLFKLSLGLIISNKPILLNIKQGDEEVVYQHMLNESKWGIIINDLDAFFGELLFSWNDALFLDVESIQAPSVSAPASISIFDSLKALSSLTIKSSTMNRERSNTLSSLINQSSASIFSSNTTVCQVGNNELDSVYSDVSEDSQTEARSLISYLKIPTFSKKEGNKENGDELVMENELLKGLLSRAYDLLDETCLGKQAEVTLLRKEISKVLGGDVRGSAREE
ncbi:hypothetical protein KGF56_002231 [Candida oxycetoniae]|uniref:Oxidant-induced cell-cycle arrest protein 5 n=1 Tax=Candida oxycetoniae TaxID=497107 RepID=A0AAI9SYB3_9ASCO|nr:uncharacterized protein KGF56_002231 [Candida oxycetoniae]KAI3404980.2 hypothetical protein KGF56_002231 [Candida oxycetoniae]